MNKVTYVVQWEHRTWGYPTGDKIFKKEYKNLESAGRFAKEKEKQIKTKEVKIFMKQRGKPLRTIYQKDVWN